MNVTIAKQFTFDAAHHLPTMPADHKCHRMHGHTYSVELQFTGPIYASGLCSGIDYGDIAAVWLKLFEEIDHRVLNDVRGLGTPTTEILALWVAQRFAAAAREMALDGLAGALSKVRVSESSTTWCEFEVD